MNTPSPSLAFGAPRPRRLARLCLGLAVWRAFLGAALCQQYHVQNWHVEDGLPDGEITALQQTPDGYLWIGTPKGLARFDGNRFKAFKTNPVAAPRDWRITWMLADHAGALWISTQDGDVVCRKNGEFQAVPSPLTAALDQKQNRAPGNWLWERRMHLIEGRSEPQDEGALETRNHLVEDAEHSLWWHVSDTMLLRLKAGTWTAFTASNGLPQGGIRQLAADHEGRIWVEAAGKLHCYDGGGWDRAQAPVALSGSWPVLAPASEGGLWVAEPRGSWFLNGGEVGRFYGGRWTGEPKPIPLMPLTSRSTVTCLTEDRTGRLWYGTAAGGVFFSGQDGAWQRLRPQNPFSQGYISCLFEDSQGNIWVGTVGDGLYCVTPQAVTMLNLPPPMENAEINTTFVAHDGALWVGTGGSGALQWRGPENYTVFGTNQGLANLHVCAILEDSKTNVWCGTSDRLFHYESGRFAPVEGPPEMSHWVKVLFEDRAGRLWIGTVGGLLRRDGDRFTVYHLRLNHEYCDIRSVAEDPQGDLWIGTMADGKELAPAAANSMPQMLSINPFIATFFTRKTSVT